MKTIVNAIFIFCFVLIKSQSETDLKAIKDIDNTQSVSMALLDNSPSIVFANSLPKKISLNTSNLSNVSVEVTPFYYANHAYKGYEFFGLKDTLNSFKYTSGGFHNLSKVTLSLNAMPKDSATTISIGARTNILTLYNHSPQKLHEQITAVANDDEITAMAKSNLLKNEIKEPSVTDSRYEEYVILLEKEKDKIKDEMKIDVRLSDVINQLKNPMITLNVSGAYSTIAPGNRISDFRTDRYGVWSTFAFSLNLNKEYTRFFKVYLFLRYLKDSYIEEDIMKRSEFTDYGVKLQGVLSKNISVAYEYVKRNGDGGDYRSVGQIQYKVNDELSFSGGFGKNFEISNTNLMTFLGISWGIVNNPKTK